MSPKASFIAAALAIFIPLLAALPAYALELVLQPSRDATIFDGEADVANGKGFLFIGKIVSGASRRALIHYDLSAIPPGSSIQSVQVRINVNRIAPNNDLMGLATLHRLTASWGEGLSFASGGAGDIALPNDSTWSYRFYPSQLWANAGGDFVASPSGSTDILSVGEFVFVSTPGLVADVRQWVNVPSTNHGWLLKDLETTDKNAKRIESRESGAFGPQLTVVYTLPPPPTSDSDVPLPAWAIALLGAALVAGLSGRSLGKRSK